MTILTRPILEINTGNIIKNYQQFQKLSGDAVAAAVVKDNAYGIGAETVSEALYNQAGCRHFFVGHGIEGAKIRSKAPDAKIYILEGMGADSIELFKAHHLTPVINSLKQYQFWKQNKIEGINPVIHIETGLNRQGFREADLQQLSAQDLTEFSFVMSHLACADVKEHFMNLRQLNEFKRLKAKYFPKTKASLVASDGVFLGEEYLFDMVRLGAGLYGINTAPYRQNQSLPVITLKAPVLQIEDVNEGDYIGYSITYQANSPKKIAIIACGYGDGLPRTLSNVGKVYFETPTERFEARILGRVSMEVIVCDVTDAQGLNIGDYAHIIDDKYTLDDIGRDAGTIGYEILSNVGKNPRADRRYK